MATQVQNGVPVPAAAALRPYALATLLFALSLGLRLLLLPGDTRLPYLTFYPATALAFYLWGGAPGALLVALASVAGLALHADFTAGQLLQPSGGLLLLAYLLFAGLMAWLMQRHRRATQQLAERTHELARREHALDTIVNEQSDIICRFDAQGRVLFSNLSCGHILGMGEAVLTQTAWQSVVHPDDLPAVQRQLALLSPRQPRVFTENRVRQALGDWRWFEFTNHAIFDTAGQLQELQTVGRDIDERKALETRLQVASQRLQDLYDQAPCGYYSLDARGLFVQINDTALAWLGCTRDEVLGIRGPRDFFNAEGRAQFDREFPMLILHGRVGPLDYDLQSCRGEVRRVSVQATTLKSPTGVFLMSRTVMYDVSELERVQQELRRVNREQQAMLQSELIGISRVRERRTVWANDELSRIFGYSQQEIVGAPTRLFYADDASHGAFGETAYEALRRNGHYRTQLQMRRRDGVLIWVDISGTLLSAQTGESLWMMLDVTEMREHQEAFERQATYDALTGLPNRSLLTDRLRQAVLQCQRQQTLMAVCFLDLDGFKAVNDQYGHAAGDQVLRVVAERLQSCVRGNDTVARLGGDEFVLLLGQLHQRAECQAVLERAAQVIAEPVDLADGRVARVHASIGVAYGPDETLEPAQLLARADQAMYQAKRSGRNRVAHA